MENKISLDQANHVYYFHVPAVGHQHLFSSVFAIDHMVNSLRDDERIHLYGYCLFDDEIHLLVECTEKPSLWLDPFLGRYNEWHQNTTGETGYLFNDLAIKRILVQPKFTPKVLRYIHQLPVTRKLTAMPEGYLYSSYHCYVDDSSDKTYSEINTDFILSLISHQRGQRIRRFVDYTNEPLSEDKRHSYAYGNHSFYFAFAEEPFVTKALSEYQSKNTSNKDDDFSDLWQKCIQLLEPITELSEEYLQGQSRHHSMPDAHYVLAWTFVKVANGPIFHVAKQFELDETTVTLNIKSVELHHPSSFLRYIEQRWQKIFAPAQL